MLHSCILFQVFLYLYSYASLLGLLFYSEDGGSKLLQKYGNLAPEYMVSKPRRQ
jgi:hypothetical protein